MHKVRVRERITIIIITAAVIIIFFAMKGAMALKSAINRFMKANEGGMENA